ncbi:hypothetical protein O181_095825 [Austropuccinia psidii MF-1]|uniref:Tet-like 2OG-Fe(II) oxygenase domain-containing protein n=1 Tax=Austropuccinia psidii MF-1 TaxID=1389203 RepID=A0A9Q3J4L0_9BASI|nr:hypothetical protein [Austropuccinia psidii MF-1]
MNRLFSSSRPTAQISMPVSANMTPSEIQRVVDVNQIKPIHFGHVAIFSSTRLLIALVEFRPFTTMSEFEVNQWDELSQFLFRKKRFTNPIATNGELLEGFMFPIGWRKCSTKNQQFILYGSVGKIENAKDEWRKQGANLSLVGCILVNYEGNIPANQGACKFASALTFAMNGFKNSPHLDKDALLYALGWWFQADKQTGQIQRDASKRCTGGKLIFPNEHFWIDLSACHGLIQVVWASSTFVHYTDPAQDNESTTLVGSRKCKKFLTPVQASNNSHANPYTCEGGDNAENFLYLFRLPTIHRPILTLVKVPNNAKNSLCLCRLPTIHTPILMLVKVPNNAENFLRLCRLPTIPMPILTLVKVPKNAKNSLRLCTLPTIHTPILTLVKAPNN